MEREVIALLWLYSEGQMTAAEFIVRMARPTRWRHARFSGSDVERAARAIESDPAYLTTISSDAARTTEVAGCGLAALAGAFGRLIDACGEM